MSFFHVPACGTIRRHLQLVALFSAMAMIATFYLVLKHYEPSFGKICHINDYFNCDKVNKSSYSEILGAPVSVLGFFSYILIFVTAILLYRNVNFKRIHQKISSYRVFGFLLIFTGIGTVFSLYLSYAEFFIIKAVCIFCVAQQILIILILFTLFSLLRHFKQTRKGDHACNYCMGLF